MGIWSYCMQKHHLASAVLVLCSGLLAQSIAVVPPAFETLPGNAGIAMPLRWSKGKMQVFIDPVMMPNSFIGETITGLRLRRSVLEGATAFPAVSRTIEIYGGFQWFTAGQIIGAASHNFGLAPRLQLFGPSQLNVAPTPAPGPNTTVGEEFVEITFTQGLPVTSGTLFLEFRALDGPLTITPENWVDAVQFETGTDQGYAVRVGDGSCTSRPSPTELVYLSEDGPLAGTTIDLEVRGAQPTSGSELGIALVWAGLDPETRPAGPSYLGYGGSFGLADPLMADCHQWAPTDLVWSGTTDSGGRFATTLDIPGSAAVGLRIGLQAGWFDPSRPVVPISLSNGLQLVCSSVGVAGHCSTFFFPDDLDVSPWGPQLGLMPVILLEY
jgi:hypothetical protein